MNGSGSEKTKPHEILVVAVVGNLTHSAHLQFFPMNWPIHVLYRIKQDEQVLLSFIC